jgi:hypothetical protein
MIQRPPAKSNLLPGEGMIVASVPFVLAGLGELALSSGQRGKGMILLGIASIGAGLSRDLNSKVNAWEA